MRILFVYQNMYVMGGVQTWLARVVPRLHAFGHEVGLLTRPRSESWDTVTAFVDSVSREGTVNLAGKHWFGLPRSLESSPAPADVLFACNLQSLLMSGIVQRHLMPDARIVAGVFHPSEYSWDTPRLRRRWIQHVGERMLRELPGENFMFFSPAMRNHPVEEFLGRDLSASPSLPIPIDTERLRPPAERPYERGKVVSVARLVPAYGYVGQMIRVVRELRDRGHELTYHSYGDGPERERLEAEARRLGVDDAVFLHPGVPYERFGEAVGDAFAFIGIGTALLEAAASGVPSLVAIDSHPGPATHGFIHETVGNTIGGHVEGHPEHSIAERLLWLEGLAGDGYREVERATLARADEFSLDRFMPRFVEYLEGAAPSRTAISGLDRAIGRLDWLVEAVLLNLGARDVLNDRFVRQAAPG